LLGKKETSGRSKGPGNRFHPPPMKTNKSVGERGNGRERCRRNKKGRKGTKWGTTGRLYALKKNCVVQNA